MWEEDLHSPVRLRGNPVHAVLLEARRHLDVAAEHPVELLIAGVGLEMTSLVAEIPGYLQGTNPLSIEAVTRRLTKILQLPLDLEA